MNLKYTIAGLPLLVSTIYGQEKEKEVSPNITYRIMAIGQPKPPEYKVLKGAELKAYLDAIKNPNDDGSNVDPRGGRLDGAAEDGVDQSSNLRVKQKRPNAWLVMLPEKPVDYPIRPFYVANSSKHFQAKDCKFLWFTPGQNTTPFLVNRERGVTFYKENKSTDNKGVQTSSMHKQGGVKISPTATHMTTFLRPSTKLKNWSNYTTHTYDTSPSKIPDGSIAIFNLSSKLVGITEVGTNNTVNVQPAGTRILNQTNSRMRLRFFFEDQIHGGFYNGNFRKRAGFRTIMVIYDNPHLEKGVPLGIQKYNDPISSTTVQPFKKLDNKEK